LRRWFVFGSLLIAVFAFFLACSSFGTGEGASPPSNNGLPDGASADGAAELEDGGRPGDADSNPCDLDQPFGPALALSGPTSLSIESARPINDDLNDILFAGCASTALSTCEIYRTNRANFGSNSGKLTYLSASSAEDSFPALHFSSKQYMFARGPLDGGPPGPRRIYASSAVAMNAPLPVSLQPAGVSEKEPYVVGNTLVYSRTDGSSNMKVWSAKLNANTGAVDGQASEVTLPFQGDLYAPVLSADLKELFVAAQVASTFTLRSARRTSETAAFVESNAFSAAIVDPVAYPVWVSVDRCTLWVVTKAAAADGRVQVLQRPKR